MESIIVAAAIPILAVGIDFILSLLVFRKTKEMTLQLDHGKEQTVTVSSNADAGEVVRAFQTEIDIAQDVQKVLKQFELSGKIFRPRRGDAVDFIAEAGDKKLAIEVKNRLDRMSLDQMNRYFATEPGVEKLLIISPQAVPDKVLSETRELVDSGRLSFVQAPDSQNPTSDLPKIVGRALEVALLNKVKN